MNLPASSDEFGTPDWLYKLLDREFQFTVDAAASDLNYKCAHYVTKEMDAFQYDFSGSRAFCNPPYGNGMKEAFARLAYEWTSKPEGSDLWVMILPTCTDQKWFHELVRPSRVLWYPIKGRVAFVGGKTSARDSHMILVFRNQDFLEFKR